VIEQENNALVDQKNIIQRRWHMMHRAMSGDFDEVLVWNQNSNQVEFKSDPRALDDDLGLYSDIDTVAATPPPSEAYTPLAKEEVRAPPPMSPLAL
jgi:hypothetical protein